MSLSSVFGDRPGNAFAVATRYDLNALSTTLRTFIAEMQKKINTILERLDAFGKEHNSDRKTDDLRWQTSDERWSETQKMFKQLDSVSLYWAHALTQLTRSSDQSAHSQSSRVKPPELAQFSHNFDQLVAYHPQHGESPDGPSSELIITRPTRRATWPWCRTTYKPRRRRSD